MRIDKKLILFLTVLILASSLVSAAPVLYFSDLTSGPNTGGQNNKGVFVTIWGKNFGSTIGSSYITIGNGQADNYPIWTDTKISFQLGANAQTGDIVVHTSEGDSNGLPFTVRSGDIYFAKTTGSDSIGNGSWSNPWLTIKNVKNHLSAGDIAYIGDGINETTPDDEGVVNCNSDTGTAANPIALVAYPGATVQIGSDANGRVIWSWWSGHGTSTSYWTISQFHLRGSELIGPHDGWRIVGNYLTGPNGDSGGGAAGIEGSGDDIYILGNELDNIGKPSSSKLYHNIYIDDNCNNLEIGWNIIHDSTANRGIQFYSTGTYLQNVKIHDNLLHDLKGNAININSNAHGTYQIYNNVIYRCALGPGFYDDISNYAGILIGGGNDATIYLYNNIIYDCGWSDGGSGSGLFEIAGFNGVIYPRNNIFYSNGQNYEPYMTSESSNPLAGAYHNLFYGKGNPPSWDTGAINLNPSFVDLSNHDFHLQSSSPAIDAGIDASAIVARDFDGNSRPQGNGFDIGAYEYTIQDYHAADTNQNGKIEMKELIAFIARWKNNEVNVNDVIDALGRWFRGS